MRYVQMTPWLFFTGLLACSGGSVMAQVELEAVPQNDLAAQSDPLAELASLGDMLFDDAPDAGGSIRAKKKADVTRTTRLKDPRNLSAKVEAVKRGTFPQVAIRVKVTRSASEGTGKDIAKNTVLVIIPTLEHTPTGIDMTSPDTLTNAGAYYLNRGDKVKIRLGPQKGRLWQAAYIERK